MRTELSRRRFLSAAPAAAALAPERDPLVYFGWLESELRRVYRQIHPRAEARVWIKWLP